MIAFLSYSQNTIPINAKQAKQAILNAIKVESLEREVVLLESANVSLELTVEAYKDQIADYQVKEQLWQSNVGLTERQVEIVKPKGTLWKIAGGVLVGVLIGKSL